MFLSSEFYLRSTSHFTLQSPPGWFNPFSWSWTIPIYVYGPWIHSLQVKNPSRFLSACWMSPTGCPRALQSQYAASQTHYLSYLPNVRLLLLLPTLVGELSLEWPTVPICLGPRASQYVGHSVLIGQSQATREYHPTHHPSLALELENHLWLCSLLAFLQSPCPLNLTF